MSAYNQELPGNPGLVREGNWFEELALKSVTGVRFYPNPQDRTTTLLTTTRCIVHTDQTLPKDYKSTMSIDIQNPQQHKDFALQVKRDVGPRRLRMEQAIRAQVEAEFTQKNATEYTESRQVDYSTETKRALSATAPGFVPYLDR